MLEIREAVLDRIFKLRKDEIAICDDQNIKQEDNLTNLRYTDNFLRDAATNGGSA